MNWSRCTFVLFSLFIVLNAKTQKTPLCGSCDKDSCPDVSGCNLIKVDQCDCCKICVRQVGETCGEPGLVCDSHLSCHQDSDLDGSSRCKGTSNLSSEDRAVFGFFNEFYN
ncbi:hypothetical protein L3Y34_008225 [Caenorhabditis briggsae]|uniref:IGFBP N-terminal domain-containing protein n=1 Tax=Caenorhabditis briggsae TaxID=6238 RepID=A0AAE9D267_CAEBR|nr:hypothetical protein L3Y34_008225 [Caenorhabditis briggsae]